MDSRICDQHTLRGSDIAGTDSRSPCFFIIGNRCIICGITISIFQFCSDVIRVHISLHAVQFLQLCDVDGIGFLFTSSHASNLTSFICCTNGYSRLLGCPSRCGACSCTSRIIPSNASCSRCYGPAADGYAVINRCIGILTDDDRIRGIDCCTFLSSRANNDIIALVC